MIDVKSLAEILQTKTPLIEVRNLTKIYRLGKETVAAVKNVSFSLQKGEILGLVGESGSGKSTLGKMLLRLVAPTSGQIFFQNEEITHSSGSPKTSRFWGERDKILCRRMQMIFQDPFASLNPRMAVGDLIAEPLKIHRIPGAEKRVDELLDLVNLPRHSKGRYPHEFSGGQRQRIGIARALALNPDFLVCDEPISALDVSIQAQIVNLLLRLQKELGLTYLFIAHDLAMVRYLSKRVAVMFKGEIVETGLTEAVFSNPQHAYTQTLISSIPRKKGFG